MHERNCGCNVRLDWKIELKILIIQIKDFSLVLLEVKCVGGVVVWCFGFVATVAVMGSKLARGKFSIFSFLNHLY
jgi:hypothetical protein